MRLAVLTTDTLHHRYFLQQLALGLPEGAEIILNVFEGKSYPWSRLAKRHFRRSLPNLWRSLALNPYFQSQKMARAQTTFEESNFFPDGNRQLPDTLTTAQVYSVNDDDTAARLDAVRPDLLLVYGTGKIHPHVFEKPSLGAINAHGGLLPGYRGLDTNLWAALEGRPEDMAVTIHQVDAELDTGAVHLVRRLGPVPNLSLANLRYHTTMLCTEMFIEVVQQIHNGSAKSTEQLSEGRYYSPMPVLLKRKVDRILRRYAAKNETGQFTSAPSNN
jgi:folate-dependent phosphoribosylglycinamide formyltransferase PurN